MPAPCQPEPGLQALNTEVAGEMHILWRSSLEFPVSLSVLKLLALMSREARDSGSVAHLDLKVLPLMMMELCHLNRKLLPLMMMKRCQKEMPCLEKRELCLDKGKRCLKFKRRRLWDV